MRKAVAVAVVLLIVAAALGALLYYRHSQGSDVRGSTVEFNPEQIPKAKPLKPNAPVVWPTFGYGANRLHIAPQSTLRPPFQVVWRAGGATLLEFPPAIAFNRLYLANGAGLVLAISTRTGARAWSYATNRCVAASPAVSRYKHGTIYETFLNRRPCAKKRAGDGLVVALSAGKGKLRWQRRIGASETSPLLVGNHLYVGDWLGWVYSLDARTGEIEWRYHTRGAIKGALAAAAGRVYVGSYDGHLYAIDARTGKLAWRARGDRRLFGRGRFYSSPAVAYGRVYIGSTDGKVYSFGATTGRRRWSHSTHGYVYGSPAVWNDRVFIGSYDKYFYCFDAATGDLRWRFRAAGPISGSATVVDGVVYFASLKGSRAHGRTYAVRATTGKLLWSFPDGQYSPVVADTKRLYLVGFAKLYGLEPRAR
jgi:outer membrane protein assembly factor BamB